MFELNTGNIISKKQTLIIPTKSNKIRIKLDLSMVKYELFCNTQNEL